MRFDNLNGKFGEAGKAIIDLAGSLLLLIPVCLVILIISWPYVAGSWTIMEGSRESSGLPILFLLKSLLLAFPVLLILQGVATACRSVVRIFAIGRP